MRIRQPSPEHQEAVSRRLAQLSAELAGVRPPAAASLHDDDWTAAHTRLPSAPGRPELLAVPEEEAPLVPLPGRHASRRAGRLIAGLVPETLRGRVALGPAQVAVIAVLVAVGLALTCWWLVRSNAEVVDAPGVVPASAAPLASLAAAPAPESAPASAFAPAPALAGLPGTATTASVTVDVAGKVRDPGIAVLDVGARVVDALAAAGGARTGVNLSGLNLARVLVDGEQIVVGVRAPTGVAASAVASAGATPSLVNINTAAQTELEALPEVGPVTAQAIIAWRTEHGGFSSVDELLEVDGIGDATLAQMAPYATV